ncbi:MAG: sigma-70 family RNA polymerase sigma factor [Armatimonadota bacterium]|nr:sigma-70 family RNA polymerase sigma factor [Armatimonadota bacterium]
MSVGADAWTHAVGEDEALARRFLDGDASAFDALYRKYYARVFTVARGILLDRDDAGDATQEAFTKIYENLPRFRGGSRLGTWIFRIAVNSAIQVSRRGKSRKRLTSLDEIAESAVETIDLDDSAQGVHKAMAELRHEDRAILSLFYWEELSLVEIGEALGCGSNAAKTRLFRARTRFKEVYEAMEEA